MHLINDDKLYDGDLAECDVCTNQISAGQPFYRCNGNPDYHPAGLDMCANCIFGGNSANRKKTNRPSSRPIQKVIPKSATKLSKRSNGSVHMSSSKKAKSVLTDVDVLRSQKRLFRENQEKKQRIESLQRQLATVTREKKATDATLKSVKSQVTNLILKNEELEKDYTSKVSDLQQAKRQYIQQKSSSSKKLHNNQTVANDKVISEIKNLATKTEKLESLVTNMYKVLNNKYTTMQTKLTLVENKVNAVVKMNKESSQKTSKSSNKNNTSNNNDGYDLFDLFVNQVSNQQNESNQNAKETINNTDKDGDNNSKGVVKRKQTKKRTKRTQSIKQTNQKTNVNQDEEKNKLSEQNRKSAENEFAQLVSDMEREQEESKKYQIGDENEALTSEDEYMHQRQNVSQVQSDSDEETEEEDEDEEDEDEEDVDEEEY